MGKLYYEEFSAMKIAEAENVKGNDKETKEFKAMVGEINDFTGKVDDLFDKFIRSDEHWFYKTMLTVRRPGLLAEKAAEFGKTT